MISQGLMSSQIDLLAKGNVRALQVAGEVHKW